MNAHYRLPALLSFPLAILFAACALGGIAVPAVYARENPFWAAQGVAQDWVDLVLVAPFLAVSAWFTLKRVRLFALLLAGALAYTTYSAVLYAFFMHFGPLFLLYVSALGLSFYALCSIVCALRSEHVHAWFYPSAPARTAGILSFALGVIFYALWLREVVPALVSGEMLKSAAESGLITNPVHVLDMAIVLPAFIVGGVALIRRRPSGYWLGPMMLGFAVVMDIALIGMAASIRLHRPDAAGPPLPFLLAMLLVTATVLVMFLRSVSPENVRKNAARHGAAPEGGGRG